MSKGSKPPAPPDPFKTAQAQTQSNKETAIANANLNRVDQTNPFGTSDWEVVGTNPDGTPKWSQNVSFSGPLQQNFDRYFSLNNALGESAQGQLGRVQDMLAKPFDLNTEAENKIIEMQRARLDPQIAQNDAGLRTKLTNQGIREGTEAWDRAMLRQGQIENDARNSMWLSARQQGVNEALTQRQFPMMEFNSLFRGQQPQMPQFSGVPGVQQAGTNVAGIVDAAYQNQLNAWKAEQGQNNSFMGGLFGLGGSILGAPMAGGGSAGGALMSSLLGFSDRRLKENVERVGKLPSGLPVYEWNYFWGGPRVRGVMADEARAMFPDAVVSIGGFLAVDYGRIG